MDLLELIRQYLDPAKYNISPLIWNCLIINSRIRFHSFFRHVLYLETEEKLALAEYELSRNHFKQYLSTIFKYWRLKRFFKERKTELIKKLSREDIILLKNFAYRSSIENNGFKDPFFHSFTTRLSHEKNHLVMVDPLMTFEDTKQLLSIHNLNIIPWFTFLKTSDYLKAFWLQLTQYNTFRSEDKLNSWNKEIKQEILHPTTFHHLLFHFAFQRIVRTFSIKRFILTCENNSWEKVVIKVFRENSPKTIIVGYQHSVIPESALGMRFLPWEIKQNNLPDIIYTTGLETEKILRSFNPGLSIPINALCALRYGYLYSMNTKKEPLKKTILVALEAIKEASNLIQTILDIKEYLVANHFKVTFRFHPAMTYDFFKTIIDATKLESFSTVSTATLIDDLNHHDCVFYWGSTVALESSFIGNALINFQSSFPLSHDPLYLCSHLKFVVTNSSELQMALESMYSLELPFINTERVSARNYIKNYFYPPTSEHLNTLIGSSI